MPGIDQSEILEQCVAFRYETTNIAGKELLQIFGPLALDSISSRPRGGWDVHLYANAWNSGFNLQAGDRG